MPADEANSLLQLAHSNLGYAVKKVQNLRECGLRGGFWDLFNQEKSIWDTYKDEQNKLMNFDSDHFDKNQFNLLRKDPTFINYFNQFYASKDKLGIERTKFNELSKTGDQDALNKIREVFPDLNSRKKGNFRNNEAADFKVRHLRNALANKSLNDQLNSNEERVTTVKWITTIVGSLLLAYGVYSYYNYRNAQSIKKHLEVYASKKFLYLLQRKYERHLFH